jgi:hypothetical protein
MREARIGELLVAAGVLDDGQVHRILDLQRASGEPFGLLCERHLGIAGGLIEQAWATQYARITRTVDPATEVYDSAATALVTRRQAWQFRVLPIRFDGPDLMIATTQGSLCRALRFVTNVIGVPAYLVLAEPPRLGEALCRMYSLPGLTPAAIMNPTPPRWLAGGA